MAKPNLAVNIGGVPMKNPVPLPREPLALVRSPHFLTQFAGGGGGKGHYTAARGGQPYPADMETPAGILISDWSTKPRSGLCYLPLCAIF